MRVLEQTPPTSQNDPAAEAERWTALREALELDGRLNTPSSRSIFKFAYRAWRAVYLNERPRLYVIGGRSARCAAFLNNQPADRDD